MKTLFFGAGPLGVLYAHRLHESGADVTILARGAAFERIKARKLSLANGFTGEQVVPGFEVTDTLSTDDSYDLVVVLVRKNKIASVLETLRRCPGLENVLFMGNNVLGPDAYLAGLPREKVLFGFPGAGGGWKGDSIEYVDSESPGAKRMPVRIGEMDGVERERTHDIRRLFEGAGVPVEMVADIDGWLKYHGAFVIPIGLGIYRHRGNLEALASDRETLRLLVRAARECGNVLRALGFTKRQPFKFNLFYWMPQWVTAGIIRRMLGSRYADVAFALHAAAARDEFEELTEDFRSLIARTSVETPSFERLARSVDQNTAIS